MVRINGMLGFPPEISGTLCKLTVAWWKTHIFFDQANHGFFPFSTSAYPGVPPATTGHDPTCSCRSCSRTAQISGSLSTSPGGEVWDLKPRPSIMSHQYRHSIQHPYDVKSMQHPVKCIDCSCFMFFASKT